MLGFCNLSENRVISARRSAPKNSKVFSTDSTEILYSCDGSKQ